MDFPPFNHHHHTSGGGGGGGNRYAPPPPPPPPQPPHHHHHHHHQFSDDRNLYQPPNRHHLPLHHPPPPPSYPSRPRPPTPPPPTPPYNPQQSHFTFNPVYRSSIPDESQKPSFFGHEQQQHHHLSPSRFSSHRFSKLENSYHESWTDPVRFPPESSSRSHLIFHDDHPPYRPTDGYDNDFQRGSVYRGELVPGFRAMEWDIDRDRDRGRDRGRDRDSDKQIQQVDRDDDVDDNYNHSRSLGHSPGLLNRCSLNTDSFSGRGNLDTDPRTVSGSTSRRADDFVKNYDPDYASLLEPKRSWNDHRDEDTRWDHSKNVDFGHGNSVPFLSGREELRNYESGKYNNRVREGGREEFKQVQKKSVLLRIGKPNSTGRNRTHDKHFSKAASFDDSSNSSFRGKNKDKDKDKDSLLHSDQRMEEGGEGRPVELDVSFKSNALVAKAIVTPSSSSLDSDSNFTPPRTRKSRAVNGSDSPLTKFGERSIRSGSSPHGSHCPSSSEKVTAKETMDKVACEVVSLDDNASLPGCSDKNKFVKSGSVESPSDTVSFRLRKKRKTINLISRPSVFQTTEKDEEPVNGERSKNSSSAIDNGSPQHAAFPSLNDVIVSKVDELPQAMVVEKDSSDFDTGTRHQLDTESNNLTPLKCSFSPLANRIDKIDPRIVNLDMSVHDMQSGPDAGDVLTEINGSVCNNFVVQDLNQHPCENEVLLSVENDIVAPSTEDLVSGREDDISGLSRLEVIENGESPTDSRSGANDTRKHSSSYNVSPEKQGLNITAEGNSSDTDSNKSCLNEIVAVVPDNGIPAESVDVLKEEEDAKLHNDIVSSSTPSSPNSSLSIFQEKNTVSETCHVDATHKHDGATIILPSNCPEGSTKAMVVIGDYPGACCGNTPDIKKRKSSYMQFSLSSPRINGTPDNAISSFLDVDLTTSPSKLIVFADDRVINSMGERKTNSVIHDTETDYDRCPSLTQSPVTDEGLPKTDVRTNLLQKDDLPALSSILSTSPHDNVALAAKTNDLVPDTLASVFTKKVSTLSGSSILTNKLSGHVLPSQNFSKNDDKFQKKPASSIGSVSLAPKSSVNNSRSTKETSNSEVIDVSSNTKTAISASPGSNITVQSLNSVRVGVTLANKQLFSSTSVPKVFPGRGRSSSVFKNSRINAPAKPITKPRTWHRTDGPSAKSLSGNKSSPNPVPPLPKRVGTGQNSYIRSGNTLVRKSVPVPSISIGSHRPTSSIYQPNPSGTDEIRKSAASGSRVDKTYSRTGGSSSPIESSKTPPLPESTTLSDSTTVCSGGLPSSPLEYLPPSTSEGTSAYVEAIECLAAPMLSENLKSSEIREDQTGPVSNKETQKTLDEGNRGQKVQYVKRKSNQLVAASNVINQSIQDVDKTQASVSDGYYKRRKNQLIRTSIGNHMMHNIAGQDDADSELQRARKINSGRSFSKRQAGKVAAKMYKHSRLSSVWTLNGQASRQNGVSLHRQQVWPHLFPWKRAKSWGSFMNMPASMSSDNTISSISRRLLLSRKRKTIYTKSSHGFSLRMSKLLSVGGSSLKWSKSIEKNSKKASEEATLAVAAAEKRKREQNGTAPIIAGTKSRNNPSRDRIFRIGLLRYKMDPSRRTLQRISDEEPSTSVRLEKEPKRPYIPRRLVIGHDEYVRIGNGNQLVRDPKKRTRIFANEKVRWSLHTARLRLAKKKKYCQFFTRFGKCNKDDGKCPYIHDQSKIAVCTKFLNGSCMDSNCKLTHKVIPERMQDCSYFLQGLCCNEHCPYRHVNVNPSASICEGFLKGYCADGNECRKKHTYVCPTFEATGVCPQGPTCKLHHPKNRSKGLKRKQDSLSGQQQQQQQKRKKNAQGRYFGSSPRHADVVDIRSEDKHYSKNNDDAVSFLEGKLADYISLNFSDEEGGETFDLTGEEIPITVNEDHSVDIGGTADFDALIKPVRIMNKNLKLTAESPVAFGSPNERTTSAFSEESDSVCK